MKTAIRLLAALASISVAASAGAQPHAPQPVSIVLVHGVLVDGSSWRGVYDRLTRDGYRVAIVQQPLTGLEQDVAATRRVLDQQEGPVVLVGHSFGGSIITEAGNHPKVKALVYVAGLQPEVGETSGEVAPPMQPASDHLRLTEDGYVFIDPSQFATDVGADLPKYTADFLAHSQMPILGTAFNTKLTVAAWHDKPSYAIIATEDHALDPAVAQRMAQRAGSKVTLLKGSHLVFVSQPKAVAKVIEAAARAIQ